MKPGIIKSAFYQAGVDTETGLKHVARIGFDCVDTRPTRSGCRVGGGGVSRDCEGKFTK
ncbi:MAG: hypothetical protein MUF81_03185 [Verrucomicrobia bacterium]|jgi:hypothetical protein|nr:hypothetical protein [Verrucomicrobiota bacterium]